MPVRFLWMPITVAFLLSPTVSSDIVPVNNVEKPTQASSADEIRPDWEIKFADGNKAVLSVMPGESDKVFHDPLTDKDVRWEQDVFSTAFTVHEEKLYCVYRAFGEDDEWRLGLAWSDDGEHFTRSDKPVLYPRPSDEWLKPFRKPPEGISFGDPRLVVGPDGRYYLFFNFFHFGNTTNDQQLAVATSSDLQNWNVHGRVFAGDAATDRAAIPERSPWRLPVATVVTRLENGRFVAARIAGQYWMYFNCYSTKGSYCLCIATSENLVDWKVLRTAQGELVNPLPTRPGRFDSFYADPVAAVQQRDGILLIYNGVNAEPAAGGDPNCQYYAHYPAQAFFDRNDPTQLLRRSDTPFKGGDEELEKKPIVFWTAPLYEAWSLVPFDDQLFLYWNHAFGRRSVGVWKAPLKSAE